MSTVRSLDEASLSLFTEASPDGLAGYTLATAKVVFELDLKGWQEIDGEPNAVFTYRPSAGGELEDSTSLLYTTGNQAYFLLSMEGHDKQGSAKVAVYIPGIEP